jgi:hypothetical protein
MRKRWFALLVGFLLTLGQVGFFLACARGNGLSARYQAAVEWDVNLYAEIAEHGYHSTIPPTDDFHVSDVTHFPGFPIAAALVSMLTRLGPQTACVLASQLLAWLFWTYSCVLLLDWGFTRAEAVVTLVLTASFPFSFFYVTGMSESAFLACTIGFFLWSRRGRTGLAAAHGAALATVRITGAALTLAPLFAERPREIPWRKLLPALAAFSALAAFFLYLQLKFGNWRLYHITQEQGWGSRADFLAIFIPQAYDFRVPPYPFKYQLVSLFVRSWLPVAIAAVFALELLRPPRSPSRIALILAAAAVWYLSFSGQYHARISPVGRHFLPCFPLLFFVVAAHARELLDARRCPIALRVAVYAGAALAAFVFFYGQYTYSSAYAAHAMVL